MDRTSRKGIEGIYKHKERTATLASDGPSLTSLRSRTNYFAAASAAVEAAEAAPAAAVEAAAAASVAAAAAVEAAPAASVAAAADASAAASAGATASSAGAVVSSAGAASSAGFEQAARARPETRTSDRAIFFMWDTPLEQILGYSDLTHNCVSSFVTEGDLEVLILRRNEFQTFFVEFCDEQNCLFFPSAKFLAI
jgi:hypothetical protein